jgi:hypothetical protein
MGWKNRMSRRSTEARIGGKTGCELRYALAGLGRGLFAARRQGACSQIMFAAHHIQHENRFAFPPIEYAARRFNYLTVAAAA